MPFIGDARIIRESWHSWSLYPRMFRELSGNLVVKLKAFVQLISTTCISLAFGLFSDEFQTIQAEICLNYDYLPRQSQSLSTREKQGKSIPYMKYFPVQSENRCAQGFISDPLSKGNSDESKMDLPERNATDQKS